MNVPPTSTARRKIYLLSLQEVGSAGCVLRNPDVNEPSLFPIRPI